MSSLLFMSEAEKKSVAHYVPLSPLLESCFIHCLASDISHDLIHDYLHIMVFSHPPPETFDITRYVQLFHHFRLLTGANRKPASAVGDQILNQRASRLGRSNPSRSFILSAMAPLGLNHHISWMNSEKQADVHEACLGALSPSQRDLCLKLYYQL